MIIIDADYDATGLHPLHFSAPAHREVCANITITNDEVMEENESIQLRLHSESAFVSIRNHADSAVLTIVDDDSKKLLRLC